MKTYTIGYHLLFFLTSTVYCTAAFLIQESTVDRLTYRAAVYEHAVYTPVNSSSDHKEAILQMMINLREYQLQAQIAGSQNVDIMIFPEYGIYGFVRDRDEMSHYIENIPDVTPDNPWIPCDDPRRYSQMLDVVIFLSCLAKNNSMYIVANYGDAESCNHFDPNCPANNQYQYNTDLAFDKKGTLIGKYHKQNLFYEDQFNEPLTPEYVFFDTDFGRFGMFTCFDILFHEPLIPLIQEYNITDVAFPTAWMDVMPFYSAIGYHSSVALAYNVNVLAANIHRPLARFQGSGIYTPIGANAFYYNRSSSSGKLVVSNLDIKQRSSVRSELGFTTTAKYNSKDQAKADVQGSFMSIIFNDWYHTVLLKEPSANITVCQRGLCCFLEYHQKWGSQSDKYAFAVFNGKHVTEGEYYLQVCVLLKCDPDDNASCKQPVFMANTSFSLVKMSGSFETPYVTPQIILTNNGSLRLPSRGSMKFTGGELTGTDSAYPLLEACLFGRMYDRD